MCAWPGASFTLGKPKRCHMAEKVSQHLGVMRHGPTWRVVDLETNDVIGPPFKTKLAACAYAFYREETTY